MMPLRQCMIRSAACAGVPGGGVFCDENQGGIFIIMPQSWKNVKKIP